MLGKSQPPWEKGCIVTRLIQAPTCCGTLRGLIQQIALKYPINGTTKAEGVIDHKRSQAERTKKIFHTGHLSDAVSFDICLAMAWPDSKSGDYPIQH